MDFTDIWKFNISVKSVLEKELWFLDYFSKAAITHFYDVYTALWRWNE